VHRLKPRDERSLVVLTPVDGALRASPSATCEEIRSTIDVLAGRGVPVVIASHHSPSDLMAIQRQLGMRQPFIAGSGGAVFIPRGYFDRVPELAGVSPEWEILDVAPPSVEHAIDLLLWLFRASGGSPLLVGVGVSLRDRALLQHVDVPVVINSDSVDQRTLRAEFPNAYVTRAIGPAGWREAVLGPELQGHALSRTAS
jgi:predicted mannosyl-3-phosphoglycerate phosphatase (HAD superfamily)